MEVLNLHRLARVHLYEVFYGFPLSCSKNIFTTVSKHFQAANSFSFNFYWKRKSPRSILFEFQKNRPPLRFASIDWGNILFRYLKLLPLVFVALTKLVINPSLIWRSGSSTSFGLKRIAYFMLKCQVQKKFDEANLSYRNVLLSRHKNSNINSSLSCPRVVP